MQIKQESGKTKEKKESKKEQEEEWKKKINDNWIYEWIIDV